MAKVMIRIVDETGKRRVTSLRSFLEANREWPVLSPREVRRLRAGETVGVGGGASPYLRITRTPRHRKTR